MKPQNIWNKYRMLTRRANARKKAYHRRKMAAYPMPSKVSRFGALKGGPVYPKVDTDFILQGEQPERMTEKVKNISWEDVRLFNG